MILAGGMARRMGGGDKGLVDVHRRPLIEYAIDRLRPQVNSLLINANNNQERYRQYGHPVIPDDSAGFNGPLAGMVSCMRRVTTGYMATVPCDAPCFPPDLVEKLMRQMLQNGSEISVAHDGSRIQPVFSLMNVSVLDSLIRYLDGGDRKVELWYARHQVTLVDFSAQPEAFLNINTPDDILRFESLMEEV